MDIQEKQLNRKSGFSLLELLVVIGILSILMVFASGVSMRSLVAYRLSSVAGKLDSDLNYGLQLASKLNRPVEIRFYRYTGTDDFKSQQFSSYQYLARRPSETEFEQMSRVHQMETGIIIHPSTVFSSLLNQTVVEAGEHDPEIAIAGEKSKAYSYVSFKIRPDGTTSLKKDSIWTITIVEDNNAKSEELPRNYRTLVINPVNGAVTTY